MNKERYFHIYGKALADRNDEKLDFSELMSKATLNANTLFVNDVEQKIYRNNFILGPTDYFLSIYQKNNNDVQKTAVDLGVADVVVINKLVEILLYEEYISEIVSLNVFNNVNVFEIDAKMDKKIKDEAHQLIKKLQNK